MAGVPMLEYQQFWTDKRSSLKTEHNSIVRMPPDAAASMQQLLKVLCSIENLASCTPASVGGSKEWSAIVSSAEDNRESYCKAPRSKTLFSALYGTYTVTLNELKNVLTASNQAGQTKQEDGLKEVRNQKRHYTEDAACTLKGAALPTSAVTVAQSPNQQSQKPLIILTSAASLITTERNDQRKLRVP
jgi:hypothetical protein